MKKTATLLLLILLMISCGKVYEDEYKTRSIPGKADNFDPIKQYDAILEFIGDDAELISIVAYEVKKDGVIDMAAGGNALVNYLFLRYINQDIIADLTGDARFDVYNAEEIHVTVQKPGQFETTIKGERISRKHKGLYSTRRIYRETHDRHLVAAPPFSLDKVWKRALIDGTPGGTRAIIRFDHQGYNFWIQNSNIHYRYPLDTF